MLQIYNTLTQKKEPFQPLVPGHISLYVCGNTVYDDCHIGHARVFVVFDVVVRFLRATGWKVKYVRNITDIDDKIIQRAHQNNESIQALTDRFIQRMREDTEALHVQPPDEEPRATAFMGEMVEMIQTLEEKGYAYAGKQGDVYFHVEKYAPYGELAHKHLEQLQAGARINIAEDKKSPLDFVLWKNAKAGEPHWESPWGSGRPGWHIECSAMSTHCLGHTFDIHGGGADLAFPHHENERAQSEGATGKKFVNTWMHVGFIQVNKEKMSKSLNNFFAIRDVIAEYDPEILRYFLMASHYRSPVNYSKDQLDQAKQSLDRIYTALRGLPLETIEPDTRDPYYQRFVEAMEDDFNTPIALSVLFEMVHEINVAREKNDPAVVGLANMLYALSRMIALLIRSPEEYFRGENQDFDSVLIEKLIEERNAARAAKDWGRGDEIRKQLTEMGIVLEDSAKGTLWKKA